MIKITNLTKQYKEKIAVNNLNLTVKKGTIHGFIGHNGAGKTTTLKAILGLISFENGSIIIDDIDVKTNSLNAKKIMAYIPDNPDIYTFMKGIDYINFICDAYNTPKEERAERIISLSKTFEIEDVLGDLVSSYSHGMRQKLVIVAALVHNPKVLIMDEPFVGLDPKASHTLKQLMRTLCDEGGCILFSTHVLEVAQNLCDEISIIKQGELVVSGLTENVVKDKSLEELFLELN